MKKVQSAMAKQAAEKNPIGFNKKAPKKDKKK